MDKQIQVLKPEALMSDKSHEKENTSANLAQRSSKN